MTMMSFRVDAGEAVEAQRWAEELGIDRSELLRDALHRHLVRLSAERDISGWSERPLAAGEDAIAQLADWGYAEDWTDWSNSTDVHDATR
jgi:hypothetical protein